MAGSGMVFEPHDGAGAVGGGDVVFFVAILCLSVLSVIILAAAGASAPGGEGKLRRRRSNGPVFVGGKGCGCGGCPAGAGVCGTYLS